jgi:hypothetical protein
VVLLDALKREAAHRLRLATDGRSIEWHGFAADGSAVVMGEPEVGWSRRMLLELVGPFVPEDLL